MATHSSVLAWRILWTEEPGRLQSTGLQKVGHNRSNLARMHAETVYPSLANVLVVLDKLSSFQTEGGKGVIR